MKVKTNNKKYKILLFFKNVSLKNTAQKMKFSIKDFFSKYDQIRRKLRIWSHLLKKSLMKNFIFCAGKMLFHIPKFSVINFI